MRYDGSQRTFNPFNATVYLNNFIVFVYFDGNEMLLFYIYI
jgi:hypothetical protein